ncbi:MAG: DUF1641 domain-containing protein [Halodesulfurarchaeum sp.]
MSEDIETLDAESEAIAEAAETLIELQQDGTLEDLTEAATAISLLAEGLDDEMVMGLMAMANDLGGIADRASQPNTVRTLEAMMDAMDEADAFDDPESVGPFGAISKMRDEDVKRGLGFFLEFMGALGRQIDRRSEAYQE